MTRWATFQPYVNVTPDGRVEIDWADCYTSSWDEATETTTYEDAECAAVLDRILGLGEDQSESDRLRRLADYIDSTTDVLPGGDVG
jgi:hypothetical protein